MGTIIILLIGIVILVALIAVIGKTSIKALTADPESQDARRNLRNFAIGFFGWPVLNAILVPFLETIVRLILCAGALDSADAIGCEIAAGVYGLILTALINIGILIILLVRRRWWIVSGILAVVLSVVVILILYYNLLIYL